MARLARRPVCILPTLLALLTRTVLGKQRWNIVDAEVLCECDWKNNFWLHIADDVQQIFSEKTDYVLVRSQKENRSRQKQPGWQRLRRAARELCPLDASRWPPPASAAVAPRWRFDVGWVGEASASTASGRAASATARTFWPKEVFSDLCLPGLVFSDLLCILDLTFTHEPSPSRMLRAGRLARRLRAVLQWVKPCWREPFATLRLSDLDHFAERWSDVEGLWPDAVPPEQLLFEGLSVDFSRASLPPTLRRCWPVTTTEQGGCWPRHTPVATGSCSMCCDVHFTRGDPSCFQGPWSFERCCLPDDLDHGWPPPTPPVEHRVRRAVAAVGEDGGDSADDDVVSGELEELRKELREEVEEEVSMEDVKALRRQELKKWLSQQSFRSPGQQKIFPELDLWVASNACVGREVEVPWFLLSDTATVDDASGLRLAAAAGALCGPGLAARGERGSAARTRTARPRQRPGTGWHKVEPYGLEILMPCKLQRPTTSGCSCDGNVSIPCGFSPAEHGTCCREQREEPEWRSLGVLTGELRSNIAHFARDALWLHRVLNDQETLQVLGFSTRLPRAERVLTKHAATECVENWQCAKTGSHMLSEMEPLETFLEEVALEGTPPLATFSAGDPALDHTICYELIVQRWRPWSFDASNVRRFRARALRKCQLEDRGLQKKIVLVKRESFTRQWKDEGKVLEHFETLALAIGADFDLVNLGRLTPCEQADALQDAMLLVAVHGADLTNMIFLPPAAAVVEIGVECELEGASVDSPFWRGPGTWMNSSILSGARQIWKEQQARGWCPAMGATLPPEAWLQGAPTSQFAKLARQANLFYTAVMDCAGAACNRAQEKGQWDRGWCNSDVKKRPFVEVDVAKKLIPVLWVVYDEYLRKLLSASSTVDS